MGPVEEPAITGRLGVPLQASAEQRERVARKRTGRSQTDRLITGLAVSYKIIRQLTVALVFTTDTLRPFGTDGNDLVIFNTTRGPDNISTLGLALTGSL